jgi:hypothetical protein
MERFTGYGRPKYYNFLSSIICANPEATIMNNWSPTELRAALKAADRKAAVEADFKKEALLNPREALLEVSDREVPTGPILAVFDYDLEFDTVQVTPPPTKSEILRARLTKLGALLFPEASENGEGR